MSRFISIRPAARLLLCLLVLTPAAARAASDDGPAQATCAAAEKTPRPAKDSAGPAKKGCDALALYYGIGRKPDYRAARACALSGQGDDDVGVSGPAILSMIYANGDGVPRDDTLATAYACDAGGAPAEISGRIEHLAQRQRDQAKDRFDFCDDITSGLMQGACAARDSRIEAAKRDAGLAGLTRNLPPKAKAAYAALRKAFESYRSAVGENEVDISGTARGAMIIEAEEAEEAAFVETLKAVLSGAGPGEGADLKVSDSALNDAYKKVQAAQDTDMWGTVTKDGIRTAQRAWLPYRDSFVVFVRAAGAKISPETLSGRLTTQRTERLRAFLPDEAR